MPRKRRVALERRRPLALADVPISERLDFMVGWSPPVTEFERPRSAWVTWEEMLADYAAVRDEFLAWHQANHQERLQQARRTVAQRRAELATMTETWRDFHEGLLAEAEEHLAGLEQGDPPFAEVIYQAALKGEDPAQAAAEYEREQYAEPPDEEPWK